MKNKNNYVLNQKDYQSLFLCRVSSPGIATGKVYLSSLSVKNYLNVGFKKKYSYEDFQIAIKKTIQQIENLQQTLKEDLDKWAYDIFTGHLLILTDKEYIGKIETNILTNKMNPPGAVVKITKEFITKFSNSSTISIREKAQDIKDLGLRIIKNLLQEEKEGNFNIHNNEEKIIVTEEILPSELLQLKYQKVIGIIFINSIKDNITSHIITLARSINIPLISTQDNIIDQLNGNDFILIDGYERKAYLNPSESFIEKKKKEQEKLKTLIEEECKRLPKVTTTIDGKIIKVLANIHLKEQVKVINKIKSNGIGLYRTEFPFMIRNSFPNEKEQFMLYKNLFSSSDYREITVRTLDAGGDKILPYYEKQLKENNPLLGTRGIRQSLLQPDIFITQINAILKASYYTKKLKILLPFISCVEEVIESKRIIFNCIRNLKKQKALINENIEIGIMIEVPSTIWLLKELAKEVDFFSIGTNDMTQYILAVDRESELASSSMFSCFHPAVLRSLNYLTSQILKLEKEMTICGAIAENELLLPFLIGLGFNRFSIEPNNIPKVKKQILTNSLEKSKELVKEVLKETNINKIQSILENFK